MSDSSSRATSYNARLGLWLFALYLALYAAFVYLSAFRNDFMARPVLGGVNLAVVYGFGLIFAAFVLAVLYMLLCRDEETERRRDEVH
jgi:uncharacterized membrane protein (DUF485 family)